MSGNLAVSTINGVDISVSPVATQAFATGQDLGVGQTWQDVTGSRVAGTTYTNSTGKPIFVLFVGTISNTSSDTTLDVNGVVASLAEGYSVGGYNYSLSALVPVGATYKITTSTATKLLWTELR